MKWIEVLDPELVKAAATSPLAILALMILVFCVIALVFFSGKNTPTWARVLVVLVFFAGLGLFGWGVLGTASATPQSGPNALRLNVYFDPPTNPNQEGFMVRAFVRGPNGEVQPATVLRHRVTVGGLSVYLELPDGNTPFFAEFGTPTEIWRTEDYSINEPNAVAKRVGAP
jgi:hypothetical protein